MEALTSSYTKIFTNNYYINKSRALLGRSEIHFFPFSNFNVKFSHSILFQHKTIQSLHSSLVSFSSQTEVSMGLETAETSIQELQSSRPVHVKFQLQKECLFGEHFLLVGDSPIIGLWDPSSAIPLNWTDGHTWMVELDIPIEKSIQFKFLLKRCTGEILWQPGPDRIFQTWKAKNTIVIAEDWENAELQKITEEQMINKTEELMVNPDIKSFVAGNVTNLREERMHCLERDLKFSENTNYPEEKPMVNRTKELVTAENNTHPKEGNLISATKELNSADSIPHEKKEPVSGNNGRAIIDSNPVSAEDEETLFTYEEGPVLVPGLTPLQAKSTEEALSKEFGKSINC